jgi:isoamylase
MHSLPDTMQAGSPYPLGATFDGGGVNFAVFSAHATRMELCLFDPAGKRQVACYTLPEYTDQVWHGYLPNARPGQLYGYRAHGPYAPEEGHRFNPHKLLLDPYARMLHGQIRWSDALYGYRIRGARADLSFDRRDSAVAMPKCVVVDDAYHWRGERRPQVPWPETVVYEAHLAGLTNRLDGVMPNHRGTFAALANPRVIDHLVKLGITSIELLPVHAFAQDRHLIEKGLRNYWGYNTLAFFAPEPSYLSEGSLHEIRMAVTRLHNAGIEVILDVVYNHTAEGSELGPTLSFRGLDNASYYRLLHDNPRYYVNDTGTGNTVNCAHPRVVQMIADSLRYWVEAFHVDGFRFDLGVTLGRTDNGFDPNGALFTALRQDPVLAGVKLISEPWDIGLDGYQLGRHPPGLAEWNGRYRDIVRRFWQGEPGQRGPLAGSLHGSADLFDHAGRRPWASVNFVTAHDGFTLHDLVSYEHKHNEANGEDNRDGHDDNASRNWGVEGETDDPAIRAQRERMKRAMLATLLVSQGTPMLLAGDEFGRTQGGNNNAYCQDNEISWLDWSLLDGEEGRSLAAFVARLTALRRRHASLRSAHYLHGDREMAAGVLDSAWFDEKGHAMTEADWSFAEGRLLALRRCVPDEDGTLDCTLVLVNGSDEDRSFKLPAPALHWHVALDSAEPGRREQPLNKASMQVGHHSVVVLVTQLDDATLPAHDGPGETGDAENGHRHDAHRHGTRESGTHGANS